MQDDDSRWLLRIEGATVRRSGRHILDDVTLHIPEGRHTAILGPNGCGKTTLIRLISRQHYALARHDGAPTVTIFGQDRWNVFDLRKMLGIVSSDLHNDFVASGRVTGFEVAISGFFASHGIAHHHEVTDEMRAKASDALAFMEADQLAGKRMDEMSTGEGRRVVIARALVADPRALLLDEPTAGLDIVARRKFLETLRGLAMAAKTIILVTHHVEEIFPEIETVVLMSNGRIFTEGAKQDMLTDTNLSAAYGAPVGVTRTGDYYAADVAG